MYLVTPMLESAFQRSFGAIDAAKLWIRPPHDITSHIVTAQAFVRGNGRAFKETARSLNQFATALRRDARELET
jgi:ABC-type transporter Mla subunit MlaD